MGRRLIWIQRTKSEFNHGAEQNEPETVSSTEESDMAKCSSSFAILDLKDYDTAEKTIHYIQVKHVAENPKMTNAEYKENLMKVKFNLMIDQKTLIYKTSVGPKF